MALTPIPYTDNWFDTFGSQVAPIGQAAKTAPIVIVAPVALDGQVVTINRTHALAMAIDWADGSPVEVHAAGGGVKTHTYNRPGNYRIRSRVTSQPDVLIDEVVRVTTRPAMDVVVANNPTVSKAIVLTFLNAIFPLSIQWGDGKSRYETSQQVMNHTYPANGTYKVQVIDATGRVFFYTVAVPYVQQILFDSAQKITDNIRANQFLPPATVLFVDESGDGGKKFMRVTSSATASYGHSVVDFIKQFPGFGQFRLLFRVSGTAPPVGQTRGPCPAMRFTLLGTGLDSGYAFGHHAYSGANSQRIRRLINSVATILNGLTGAPPFAHNEWAWAVFDVQGTTLKGYYYKDGDVDPGVFTMTATDATFDATHGNAGLSFQTNNTNACDIAEIRFTTPSVAADPEPPAEDPHFDPPYPWEGFTVHQAINDWIEEQDLLVPPEWFQLTIAMKKAYLAEHFGDG